MDAEAGDLREWRWVVVGREKGKGSDGAGDLARWRRKVRNKDRLRGNDRDNRKNWLGNEKTGKKWGTGDKGEDG